MGKAFKIEEIVQGKAVRGERFLYSHWSPSLLTHTQMCNFLQSILGWEEGSAARCSLVQRAQHLLEVSALIARYCLLSLDQEYTDSEMHIQFSWKNYKNGKEVLKWRMIGNLKCQYHLKINFYTLPLLKVMCFEVELEGSDVFLTLFLPMPDITNWTRHAFPLSWGSCQTERPVVFQAAPAIQPVVLHQKKSLCHFLFKVLKRYYYLKYQVTFSWNTKT